MGSACARLRPGRRCQIAATASRRRRGPESGISVSQTAARPWLGSVVFPCTRTGVVGLGGAASGTALSQPAAASIERGLRHTFGGRPAARAVAIRGHRRWPYLVLHRRRTTSRAPHACHDRPPAPDGLTTTRPVTPFHRRLAFHYMYQFRPRYIWFSGLSGGMTRTSSASPYCSARLLANAGLSTATPTST